MRVSDAMNNAWEAVRASDSLREAAQKMRERDIGMLLVNDDQGKVAGLITDRDIAVRAVADGADPEEDVATFMSRDIVSCYEDEDLEQAARTMGDQQLRRLLVCNRSDEPVGVLAQADIAQALGEHPLTGEVVREISEAGGKHTQTPH